MYRKAFAVLTIVLAATSAAFALDNPDLGPARLARAGRDPAGTKRPRLPVMRAADSGVALTGARPGPIGAATRAQALDDSPALGASGLTVRGFVVSGLLDDGD